MSSNSRLSRRAFLAGSVAAGAALSGARSRPKGPNILFIMTDQQHAGMLSCAGNNDLKTPHLDALAASGVRFERAYCTNPVCVPSRFSLQTGRFPTAVGCRFNESRVDRAATERFARRSLGAVFRRAGWRTYYGGKVHLPGAMADIRRCGYNYITRDRRLELARRCAAFLREEGKDRRDPDRTPFLLFVSFINPHDICYMALNDYNVSRGKPKIGNLDSRVCESVLEEARRQGIASFVKKHAPRLPPNFEPTRGEPAAIGYLLDLRPFRRYVREKWTPEMWRLHRWLYCRLTERVDRQIGIVLEALEQSGLAEDTLVVFTSDHGDMDSAHRMEHKTVFYEEAVRIPFLVSWKGTIQGGRVDREHLVSNGLDLLPTLCDLAGVKAPADLPGRSLRPLLEGSTVKSWRQELFLEDQIGFLIHTGRYKYALFDVGKPGEMLTDLENDPGEMENLASSPRFKELRRELRSRLTAELARRGVKTAGG